MSSFVFEFTDGYRLEYGQSQVARFRVVCFGEAELSHRVSQLFCVTAMALMDRYGLLPQEILQPVFDLENGTDDARTKPAAPFMKPPLRGLWHKHFTAARCMAHNISAELSRGRLGKMVREMLEPYVDKDERPPDQIVSELARRIVEVPLKDRWQQSRQTGEWIIYMPRSGKNYYLACVPHKYGDASLFEMIEALASIDFPDFARWMNEARSALDETG